MPLKSATRLSIVIATHHRADLLRRAINSVLALGSEVQIVLCSDEGSEPTRQVAASMLRPHDIFLCLPGYQGPAETRNAGIAYASSPYVSFLDDDDTVDEELVGSLIPHLTPDAIHFCNYRKVFECAVGGELPQEIRRLDRATSRKQVAELMVRNFIHIAAVFIPAEIARRATFRPELRVSEDWEFLLQLFKLAPFRHHELVVTNWHFLDDGTKSRNQKSKALRFSTTEYVYKLHQSEDPQILQGRQRRLEELRP